MRGPSGEETSIDKRVVSNHQLRGAPTASAEGDPHRWAQPRSSWVTATVYLPPMRFTITTTTPKRRRPSASETYTSHRAEHDTVPKATSHHIASGGNIQCTYEKKNFFLDFVTVAVPTARRNYDRYTCLTDATCQQLSSLYRSLNPLVKYTHCVHCVFENADRIFLRKIRTEQVRSKTGGIYFEKLM